MTTPTAAQAHAINAPSPGSAGGAPSRRGQWMALTAALLGWMFDGAEMGVFSMVGRPALADLFGPTADPAQLKEQIGLWFGVITACFLIGAATGGVLFGWLGDRIGRVRAMTLSVLTYALFTGLCGMAGSAAQLGVLRFIAALGMGGEWSLGVALVMEVWPNRSRALMAGLIGAAGNLGYMLVGFIGLGLHAVVSDLQAGLTNLGFSEKTVEMLVRQDGWRILMMLGTTPALLTFLIRLFVPESERWQHEKDAGRTSNWVTSDLLGVLLGALGPLGIVLLITTQSPPLWVVLGSIVALLVAVVGYSYPVKRYLERSAIATGRDKAAQRSVLGHMLLAAGLSGVALLGTWGSMQWAPSWANEIGDKALHPKEMTQIALAFGAIIGTILAALMGDWFGRRITYSGLCIVSLLSELFFFQYNTSYNQVFLATAFLGGLCTASFYGWLPLYLPELFSTNVRATGQGFGFNFGRILAAIGTLYTGTLFSPHIQLFGKSGYPVACSAASAVYLLGLVIIWLGPETRGKPLPE